MGIHDALSSVFIVVAYKPPNRELLHPDSAAIFDAHRRVIIVILLLQTGSAYTALSTACRAKVIGPAQPTYYPSQLNVAVNVLGVMVIQNIDCMVHVSSSMELSSDHLPILVHVTTQHVTCRDFRKVLEWDQYGPDSIICFLLSHCVAKEINRTNIYCCLLYTSRCV